MSLSVQKSQANRNKPDMPSAPEVSWTLLLAGVLHRTEGEV